MGKNDHNILKFLIGKIWINRKISLHSELLKKTSEKRT